jgi:aminomethyltransferase
MVDFAGWSMPVQYTSIVEEHRAVRERVGLFDISHMGRLRFDGPGALDWIDAATTNDPKKLQPGQIQYSLLCDGSGGVIDDLLVYRLPDDGYGIVCNASNRARVLEQLGRLKGGREAGLEDRTEALAMIAVQGPAAVSVVQRVVDGPLSATDYYWLTQGTVPGLGGVRVLASRTGYTGEDGFELAIRAEQAEALWTALLDAGSSEGIKPCGLGARDTLRFEAAMPLYGHELSERIHPYEAGVGWAVKLNKGEFEGREALVELKRHSSRGRVGLELAGKRIAREGMVVKQGERAVGVVTSGTFSPTLGKSLAMALVDSTCAGADTKLSVEVRGHEEAARVVPLPFYRRVAQ